MVRGCTALCCLGAEYTSGVKNVCGGSIIRTGIWLHDAEVKRCSALEFH